MKWFHKKFHKAPRSKKLVNFDRQSVQEKGANICLAIVVKLSYLQICFQKYAKLAHIPLEFEAVKSNPSL